MTAAEHNATRGQALTIEVIDYVREQCGAGVEVTMWNIRKHIAKKHGIAGYQSKQALYERIKTTIRALKHSNIVHVERTWKKDLQRTVNIITLCPSPK